jgi:hypothetical protein
MKTPTKLSIPRLCRTILEAGPSSYTLVNVTVYPGGLLIESIIAQIDLEISRLQQARALLAATDPGPKVGSAAIKLKPATKSSPKRRVLSAETKEKMRLGQLKRWAAAKKSAKPAASGAGASKPPKKAAKTAS